MPMPSKRGDATSTSSATFSACGRYRYMLTRAADADAASVTHPAAVFIMLNPSTADASLDDPTIRRCRHFAKTWACDGIAVVNLYALRSPHPAALWLAADPVGPRNDRHLRAMARAHTDVICGWGAHARADRVLRVTSILLDAGARLWCLGTNLDGLPRHPLYVRSDQTRTAWTPRT